ncbi:MAG: hypothetical protein ACM3S0_09420 [Acidobacteriota bacterium]
MTLAFLFTGVLLVLLAAELIRERLYGHMLPSYSAEDGKQAIQTPSSGGHLSAGRREGKWAIRLANVGRLEFLEVSLALPRGMTQSSTPPASLAWSSLQRTEKLAIILFVLSLGIYAMTRLVALDEFPIYFFADEAIESVLASQLIQHGMRDYQNHLLPVFFNTYGFFNPLISVYFHVVGVALFGKSIIVTRATSAIVTLIGSAAVGLILKACKSRYWWAGVLFLAAIPAWFLHSRTAFETASMVSLYACFLLLYLLYRLRSPKFIFPTLVLAAATFYSYGNGQLVVGLTGVMLFFSDLRYHLKNWRMGLAALGLLALLALPYYQFRLDHADEVTRHLRTLDTYLFRAAPLESKVREFLGTYAYGLSPQYWFFPNSQDLVRHRMLGYGNIALWMLPLVLVGAAVCFWRLKSPAYRLVLIAALASPIGGALTQIAITRVLAFVIPASILATVGLEFLIERLRRPSLQSAAPFVVWIGLAYASLAMFNDALTNGPLWFKDYGLYGMQWGAKQLFQIIPEYLDQSPDTVVNITPTWANGTDVFLDFFLPNEPRVRFANVDALLTEKQPLDDNMVFIMTPEELNKAHASNKFKPVVVEQVLGYPDGSDGFYFARLAYVDNVEQIFAAEQTERRKPVVEQIQLDGENVTVSHSRFDNGRLADLFDNDTFTLARVMEANPAFLEFTFPSPRRITGVAADFGTMDLELTALLYPTPDDQPVKVTQTYRRLPPDPHIEMSFEGAPPLVSKIRLEIKALDVGEVFKIHIREIKLK